MNDPHCQDCRIVATALFIKKRRTVAGLLRAGIFSITRKQVATNRARLVPYQKEGEKEDVKVKIVLPANQ